MQKFWSFLPLGSSLRQERSNLVGVTSLKDNTGPLSSTEEGAVLPLPQIQIHILAKKP
jgi:hypothetical protein